MRNKEIYEIVEEILDEAKEESKQYNLDKKIDYAFVTGIFTVKLREAYRKIELLEKRM